LLRRLTSYNTLLLLLFPSLPLIDLLLDVAFGHELCEQLRRAKSEIHQDRMDRAESHAEMLIVKGDWDILVNTVADVANHELLEGHRLEFHLVFDVLA